MNLLTIFNLTQPSSKQIICFDFEDKIAHYLIDFNAYLDLNLSPEYISVKSAYLNTIHFYVKIVSFRRQNTCSREYHLIQILLSRCYMYVRRHAICKYNFCQINHIKFTLLSHWPCIVGPIIILNYTFPEQISHNALRSNSRNYFYENRISVQHERKKNV